MTTMNVKEGPIVRVRRGANGHPVGAAAEARIERPLADVWAAVADLETYGKFLPMVNRVRQDGDRVTFDLKFKVGIFSAGFQFTGRVTMRDEKELELVWVSGEPRDIRLCFTLTPTEDGAGTLVEGDGEFDPMSMGWLAKTFLKHHPEIQFGIFPGVALALIDALERAVAARG